MENISWQNKMKESMWLFPGIGYHCDKPLLYYSGKLGKEAGLLVHKMEYGFSEEARQGKIDPQKAYEKAYETVKKKWPEVWEKKSSVFLGKSLGSILIGKMREEENLSCPCVFYTPVQWTLDFFRPGDLVFHGTKDPWIETPQVVSACEKKGCELILIQGGNHSLETGHILTDLQNLNQIMHRVEDYLKG